MGTTVAFNPDLALPNIKEFKAGRCQSAECIPTILTKGKIYSFLKKGQPNYSLHGEVPLIATTGNQNLSRPKDILYYKL